MAKILIVEDDVKLADGIVDILSELSHTVEHVVSGEDGLQLLRAFDFEVLILDWMLPKMSGLDLLKILRKDASKIAVLILTGKTDVNAIELGLDAGADDYLVKPFHTRELAARVRSLLRRAPGLTMDKVTIGYLSFERESKCVFVGDKKERLTDNEFAVLDFLLCNIGRPFSAKNLLNQIWKNKSCSEETVRTTVFTLRKKINLAGQPELLKTEKGSGYKIEHPESSCN